MASRRFIVHFTSLGDSCDFISTLAHEMQSFFPVYITMIILCISGKLSGICLKRIILTAVAHGILNSSHP